MVRETTDKPGSGKSWRIGLSAGESNEEVQRVSGKNFVHDMAVDIGEAEIATGVPVGQFLVIQA